MTEDAQPTPPPLRDEASDASCVPPARRPGPDLPDEAHAAPDDPLMLALTDEPVPAARRRDARFLAEHRAALADVALLRAQVRFLGDALGDVPGERGVAPAEAVTPRSTAAPAPFTAPPSGPVTAGRVRRGPHPPARARRRLTLALKTLAAVCAAALVGGLGWLAVSGGAARVDSASSDAARGAGQGSAAGPRESAPGAREPGKPGDERYVACARLIAEGTVERAERLPGGGQYRITFRVEHYYKPSGGASEITFVRSRATGAQPRPKDHVLVGIPQAATSPDLWSTGADLPRDRAWITRALAGVREEGCR